MDMGDKIKKGIKDMLLNDKELLINVVLELKAYNGILDYMDFYENTKEYFEGIYGDDLMKLAKDISFGDYNPIDDYLAINEYGRIYTFSNNGLLVMAKNHIDDIVEDAIKNIEHLTL